MAMPLVPVYFAPVPTTVHQQWLQTLKQHGILYVYGMFGYGKTAQAVYFAQTNFKLQAYFSANDPAFIKEVTAYFEAFKKGRAKSILILDDLQWITDTALQQQLIALLLQRNTFEGRLQIMLLSRGDVPPYLVPLRLSQALEVANKQDLLLNQGQILSLMLQREPLTHLDRAHLKRVSKHCLEDTTGIPLLVQAYIMRLIESPYDLNTVMIRARRDIQHQRDAHFLSQWSPNHRQAMIAMGAFQSFDTAAAKLIMGKDAPQLLADFLIMDDFLRFEAPDTYHIHPNFSVYLTYRLSLLDNDTKTQLYQIAANYCEQRRDFAQALRCYRLAGRSDKIVQIVVYLLENAEGCVFAELCADYMDVLTPEREQQNPSILGAKAMYAAYRMDVAESQQYLQRLKWLSEQAETVLLRNEALSVYVRTLMASPCVDANELKDNLMLCAKYVQKNGVALKHIMPTGNFPSVINGGVDLLPWSDQRHILYPIMKVSVPLALGTEGIGVADATLGESHYESGENAKAIARLSQALSDANFKGSIRVQYAVTAIMARVFRSEGQAETAQEILNNLYEKAVQSNFTELVPNITASLIQCELRSGNLDDCTHWLQTQAPDEHAPFYITTRFRLMTKAQVYTALGRELEALHIIDVLTQYAQLYHRPYFQIELLVLKAILQHRRQEPWQADLVQAVELAHPYGLQRIFADQGAALFPLWKEMDWSAESTAPSAYLTSIAKQLKEMATLYPQYLQVATDIFDLSEKELLVLQLLSQGASNTKIAEELNFTTSNAKFHVSNIMKKLKADNRTSAVTIAQAHGLI